MNTKEETARETRELIQANKAALNQLYKDRENIEVSIDEIRMRIRNLENSLIEFSDNS